LRTHLLFQQSGLWYNMTSAATAHALKSMTCLPPGEVSADELVELIEGAEKEGNVAAIVAALLYVSQTDPALEDGAVAAGGGGLVWGE
jgi:hypothetical protein